MNAAAQLPPGFTLDPKLSPQAAPQASTTNSTPDAIASLPPGFTLDKSSLQASPQVALQPVSATTSAAVASLPPGFTLDKASAQVSNTSQASPEENYNSLVASKAADPTYLPVAEYAKAPDPLSIDPEKDPDGYQNAVAQRQLSIDVQYAKNQNPPKSSWADLSKKTLGAIGGVGDFVRNVLSLPEKAIATGIESLPGAQTLADKITSSPTGRAVINTLANNPYTQAVATGLGVGASGTPGTITQQKNLEGQAATAALKENIYNPETNTPLGAPASEAAGILNAVAPNAIRQGSPKDIIEQNFMTQAPALRSASSAYNTAAQNQESQFGPMSDADKTALATKIATDQGVSDPQNILWLKAGGITQGIKESGLPGIIKGAVSNVASKAAELPGISPVVAAVKNAGATARQVTGLGVQVPGQALTGMAKFMSSKPGIVTTVGGMTAAEEFHRTGDPGEAIAAGLGAASVPYLFGWGGGKEAYGSAILRHAGESITGLGENIVRGGPAQPELFQLPTQPSALGSLAGMAGTGLKNLTNSTVGKNITAGMIFSLPNLPQADNMDDAAATLVGGGAFSAIGGLMEGNPNAAWRRVQARPFAEMSPQSYQGQTFFNNQPIDLNGMHAQATQYMDPNAKLAVDAQRGLLLPTHQVYAVDGNDLNAMGFQGKAGVYDDPRLTTDQVGPDGKPIKITLVNKSLIALNHEGFHGIWDVMTPIQQAGLAKTVADNVPADHLQDAYVKYVVAMANSDLPSDQHVTPMDVTTEGGSIVPGDHLEPNQKAAVNNAVKYMDPQTLLKEYIAEQGSYLVNNKAAPIESMAGAGTKSIASALHNAITSVKQSFGVGDTTGGGLGFEENTAVQNNLRSTLQRIAQERLAQGPVETSTRPVPGNRNVPFADIGGKPPEAPSPGSQPQPPGPSPIPAGPLASLPVAQAPTANPPQPAADPKVEANYDAASKMKLPGITRTQINTGIASARADGFTKTDDIIKRILNPAYQLPKAATPTQPELPLANETPAVEAPKTEGPLAIPAEQPPQEPGAAAPAAVEPEIKGPLNAPPLIATRGRPAPGLSVKTQRRVDAVGNITQQRFEDEEGSPTILTGTGINPKDPAETALAGKAAEESGDSAGFTNNLNEVQQAIPDGNKVKFSYNSADSRVEGLPTSRDRKDDQEASDLNLAPRKTVETIATPNGIEVIPNKVEPIINDLSGMHAKTRALDAWDKARPNSIIKQEFPNVKAIHTAIDEVVNAENEGRPIQGLNARQVRAVHKLLDDHAVTRIYVNGYNQGKVITNSHLLINALDHSQLIRGDEASMTPPKPGEAPSLGLAYQFIKDPQFPGGNWAETIKARNENMARGYRGDGKPFLNDQGVDPNAEWRRTNPTGQPIPIDDWKIQVLNSLEGGTSPTFYREGNTNAPTAGRSLIAPTAAKEISTNPFQAKLDALGDRLHVMSGDRDIKGVDNIISPATEKLRLNRVVSAHASPHTAADIPPSSYAQRSAGFMPEVAKEKELANKTNSDNTKGVRLINENNQDQQPAVNAAGQRRAAGRNPTRQQLRAAGNSGGALSGAEAPGRAGKPSGKETPLDSTALGAGSGSSLDKGNQIDRYTGTGASTPEQWVRGYQNHRIAQAGDGELRSQEEEVFAHAGAVRAFIAPSKLAALDKDKIKGGVEHDVFVPPLQAGEARRQIYKTTKSSGSFASKMYGLSDTPEEYFRYLDNMDKATDGKLKPQVLGVTLSGTDPSIVTKQNFIEGQKPGEHLVGPDGDTSAAHKYFHDKLVNQYGFEPEGFNTYRHKETGVQMIDAHRGNMMEDADGNLIPFDVHFRGDITKPMFMPEAPDPESPEGRLRADIIGRFHKFAPIIAPAFDHALASVNALGSPELYQAALNVLRDPTPPIRGKAAGVLANDPSLRVYTGNDRGDYEDEISKLYEGLLRMHFLGNEDLESNKDIGPVIDPTGEVKNYYDLSDLEKKLLAEPSVGLLTKLDEANATPWIEDTLHLGNQPSKKMGPGLGLKQIDENATAAFDAYFGHNNWLIKPNPQNLAYAGKQIYFPEPLKEILAGRKVDPYWRGDTHLKATRADILRLNPDNFIVQRQIPTDVSKEDRLTGATVLNDEKRVHIQTDPETGVHVIRYATFNRGDDAMPNCIEDYQTQMGQLAALKAVEAMEDKHKQGQFYGVDVVPAKEGSKKYLHGIAELNPTQSSEEDPEGEGGLSGFMADNPAAIDAYTSAIRGELPVHARLARVILAMKVKEMQAHGKLAPNEEHQEEVASEKSEVGVLANASYMPEPKEREGEELSSNGTNGILLSNGQYIKELPQGESHFNLVDRIQNIPGIPEDIKNGALIRIETSTDGKTIYAEPMDEDESISRSNLKWLKDQAIMAGKRLVLDNHLFGDSTGIKILYEPLELRGGQYMPEPNTISTSSENYIRTIDPEIKNKVIKALNNVLSVHSLPLSLKLNWGALPNDSYYSGEHLNSITDGGQINIRANSKNDTIYHELAHAIYSRYLKTPNNANTPREAKVESVLPNANRELWAGVKKARESGSKSALKYAEYLRQPSEVFARAYSYYIQEKMSEEHTTYPHDNFKKDWLTLEPWMDAKLEELRKK